MNTEAEKQKRQERIFDLEKQIQTYQNQIEQLNSKKHDLFLLFKHVKQVEIENAERQQQISNIDQTPVSTEIAYQIDQDYFNNHSNTLVKSDDNYTTVSGNTSNEIHYSKNPRPSKTYISQMNQGNNQNKKRFNKNSDHYNRRSSRE